MLMALLRQMRALLRCMKEPYCSAAAAAAAAAEQAPPISEASEMKQMPSW
jgi:hypothetical protein